MSQQANHKESIRISIKIHFCFEDCSTVLMGTFQNSKLDGNKQSGLRKFIPTLLQAKFFTKLSLEFKVEKAPPGSSRYQFESHDQKFYRCKFNSATKCIQLKYNAEVHILYI